MLLTRYAVTSFTSFFVTLSALPAQLVREGVPQSAAGTVTAVFLIATVAAQSLVPRLRAAIGMTPILAGSLVLLGAPSLLLVVDGNLVWVMAISVLRGMGFGGVTVLGSSLTANLFPVEQRGEAIGIYGLAIAVPSLVALPAGVALVATDHFTVVALLGASALLGLPGVRALGRAAASHAPSEGVSNEGTGIPGSRRRALLAAIPPSVVLLVVTVAGGGFLTFLPIVRPVGALATSALLVWGLTGAVARWGAGRMADRSGLRHLLPGASVISAGGIAIVVLGLVLGHGVPSWTLVLLGSAVLGIGYGAIQNLTLVAAFSRARQREPTTVSAVWNAAFDAGTALGAGLVGALTVVLSVPAALAATAVLIVASLPLAVRSSASPSPS